MAHSRRLVLGSSSPYRKALLERLGLPFEVAVPGVDERPEPSEAPGQTALRLSALKARALADRYPDALIIGSDQVATCGAERLHKPGNHDNAKRQLQHLSGAAADFHTAVSLYDAAARTIDSRLVRCTVLFRPLDERRIEAYLRREQPYDCAGSAKIEGLGIALVARIETDDPTSLIGLPLIALCEMLERAGLSVL